MLKTKKQMVQLLAVGAVSALILSGCATAEEDASTDSGDTSSDSSGDTASNEEVTIELARFFGDCDDTTEGVTDVNEATTECEVIQILTNAFNAEDNGYTVEKLGGQAWGDYYTQLGTTFSGGNPPDVAVMHQHRLPDYVGRGLLTPVTAPLNAIGVDWSDYTAPALGAATYEGEQYGVPFDIHGSLWHVNVDIYEEAGLVDDSGEPIMPNSPDELLEQCQAVQDATGKQYFAHDWFEFGIGARLFLGLVWQQGGDITEDGVATPDSPEGAEALSLLNQLANDCSNPEQGYTDSDASFKAGDVAVLHNGTWIVDEYDRVSDFEYRAMDIPNLYGNFGSWGDSHMWVMPTDSSRSAAEEEASLAFMAYLYENVGNWAIGTGHIAPRESIIESADYSNAVQRDNYAGTAAYARMVPAVPGWAGAWGALSEELNATWVAGKDQAQALADAESRMNDALAD